jgi:hypothetical protein
VTLTSDGGGEYRRWTGVIAVGLVIWGLIAAAQGKAGSPPARRPGEDGDIRMYQAITARVVAGTPYYSAVAVEMPARGYAVRPVFNWRLPTLAWLNSLSPSPWWGRVAFWALSLVVIGLWTMAAGLHIPRTAVIVAVVVTLASVSLLPVPDAIFLHEVWAGLLIAASLASWAIRRISLSVVLGVLAMLIRELALPYVLLMAVLALRESRRREAAAWSLAALAFLACWGWHLREVLAHMPAEGLHNSWLAAGGWPFVLTASRCSVFLMFLPSWMVAVLVPLAWAGFWRWTNAAGQRIAMVLTAYFLMFTVIGRADNWYWGFLVAPLIPLGFFGYFFDQARARVELS